ncbi:DUF975 family protein [Paenibacillus montanisoli]|uniref:DUF975 domain-containing protein n=1 Tax=Paenibacillus montanisoli TaxID=2081970 RepID=A0A328TSH5_9BACL|nr:DUF975 family protein [Paenibacillus montanisoli]RAP73438.1 hypothetical protein DL346_27450 [Paenibacillus montanisoli]
MLTNAQIRAKARESLAGKWKPAVIHFLLYMIVMMIISSVTNKIHYIGWAIGILLEAPLAYGLYNHYLDFARSQVPEPRGIFRGFERYKETLILYVAIIVFTLLWTLLFVIPGIIAAFRYSQSYYILRDNPGLTPMEAINRSKAMMAGYKWKLFMLYLSFIGWALLCILTLGIGFLWLGPYYSTAAGHFYEQLRGQQGQGGSAY